MLSYGNKKGRRGEPGLLLLKTSIVCLDELFTTIYNHDNGNYHICDPMCCSTMSMDDNNCHTDINHSLSCLLVN